MIFIGRLTSLSRHVLVHQDLGGSIQVFGPPPRHRPVSSTGSPPVGSTGREQWLSTARQQILVMDNSTCVRGQTGQRKNERADLPSTTRGKTHMLGVEPRSMSTQKNALNLEKNSQHEKQQCLEPIARASFLCVASTAKSLFRHCQLIPSNMDGLFRQFQAR